MKSYIEITPEVAHMLTKVSKQEKWYYRTMTRTDKYPWVIAKIDDDGIKYLEENNIPYTQTTLSALGELEQEPKERVRRVYAEKGTRSQKMMTFRIDLENVDFLERQGNKGRYINDLIAKARAQAEKTTEE